MIGGLTAVYVAAGRFGLSLALINKSTSAVWLPTGIAIAALLLIGTYTWPAIAVGSFSRVLLDLPPNDERLKRATQAINRNLLVQARLVSDIIDVSRGAGGRLRLKRAAVDVTPIVNAAIGALRETAAAHQTALETTLPVTPAMVTGDAERLQQVVCNAGRECDQILA